MSATTLADTRLDEQELRTLRTFATSLQVAHHIPGRLRVKLDPWRLGKEERGALKEAQRFQSAVEALEGIRSFRLNVLAFSCTIEYDAQRIAPVAWTDLLAGTDSEPARKLAGILEARYLELKGS